MAKKDDNPVLTSDTTTGKSRILTPGEKAAYADKTKQTLVSVYKHMESENSLAGFKKENPKGHAALKKVYDDHVKSTAAPAAKKPAAKTAAKPAAKPAVKPAAKKAAPAKKK
jgi:hypothetical protein